MASTELLERPATCQTPNEALEEGILGHLEEQAVIGLDALVILLPEYRWSHIFHAIDRLARALCRQRCDYTIFSILYVA